MSYPKTNEDLFTGNRTDKHFLLGSRVLVDQETRTVLINTFSSLLPVRLNDKIPGDGPTVPEISRQLSINTDGSYTDMLVSGGAVVGLGTTWGDAELIFLQKDPGAPTDASRQTMPAGRMDEGLAAHCYREALQEIVLWGNGKVYYPELAEVPLGTEEVFETVSAAVKKGNVPENLEIVPCPVKVHSSLKNSWSISLFVDGQHRETVDNMMIAVDEKNNTLEFRQLFLLDLEIAKDGGDLEGIADGDGFGRNVVVVSTQDFLKYVDMVENATAEELRDMILKSQTPALDVVVTTEPQYGGKFGRFFWGTKGVVASLTTTVTALADVLREI